MPVMKIVTYPDSRLRRMSKPIVHFDDKLAKLTDSMFKTMFANNGAGLAAVQVGILKRIWVASIPMMENTGPDNTRDPSREVQFVVINPEFIKSSGSQTGTEGCLSLPGLQADVKRYDYVVMRFQDLSGTVKELDVSGFIARVFQHETDHLNGRLYIDLLPEDQRKKLVFDLEQNAKVLLRKKTGRRRG